MEIDFSTWPIAKWFNSLTDEKREALKKYDEEISAVFVKLITDAEKKLELEKKK